MVFVYGFYGLSALCAFLFFYTRAKLPTSDDPQFNGFQRTYLTVYLLAVAGDWLQGPHVYALYESYGMSKHQIEILFIAGFGSSMLFGTFIGSIADKFGRKTNCFIYGLLYGAACITKHFADFNILMLGRLLGGIATSILYSAFESWLIYEHHHRGFNEESLGTLFSQQFLGNSLVAIVTGVVAQYAADIFGFTAPFDLALTSLMIMCVLIFATWTENYGDQKAPIKKSFIDAWQTLLQGDGHRGTIPHGYIFAGFMVAIMIGASCYKLLEKLAKPESFMRGVLVVAGVCLYIPVLIPNNTLIIFAAFITFEVCVGIFWPAMGVLRGTYVPENTRATIMNFFRVPLNIIVVGILIMDFPMKTIFQFCSVFLFCAGFLQHWLYRAAMNCHFKGASNINNKNSTSPTKSAANNGSNHENESSSMQSDASKVPIHSPEEQEKDDLHRTESSGQKNIIEQI